MHRYENELPCLNEQFLLERDFWMFDGCTAGLGITIYSPGCRLVQRDIFWPRITDAKLPYLLNVHHYGRELRRLLCWPKRTEKSPDQSAPRCDGAEHDTDDASDAGEHATSRPARILKRLSSPCRRCSRHTTHAVTALSRFRRT
jgi:hypothetical protein